MRLYKALQKEKKEQHLKVYWYTGKDQVRPLNAVKKQRNCHIKFAAYDDEVLIIGNGNQDSQSWFHSQEVNVMVDSKVNSYKSSPINKADDVANHQGNDGYLAHQPKYNTIRTGGYRRDMAR